MRSLMVVCALLGCAHPSTTSSSATSAAVFQPMAEPDRPVPPDLVAQLEGVARTAGALSEMMANSVSATRAMLAVRKPSDLEVFAVLTVETPWAQGWNVLFIAERPEGGVFASFEARRPKGEKAGAIQRLDDPRPLVGNEVEAWSARQTAVDAYVRNGPCHGRVDALVLPPADADEPFTVYVLPIPGTDSLAIGGYRRMRVSRDARRVLSDEPMSEGCLTVSATANPRWIRIRNRTQAVPDEVLLMLATLVARQFEVVTSRGRWDITSGKVRFLGEAPR